MRHYLGVDVGTFETKGVIVTVGGEIVAQASRAHQMQVPQPGWAEQEPAVWLRATEETVGAALAQAGVPATALADRLRATGDHLAAMAEELAEMFAALDADALNVPPAPRC